MLRLGELGGDTPVSQAQTPAKAEGSMLDMIER
jgi:hypothetical protein